MKKLILKYWKFFAMFLAPVADYYLMEAFCINAFTTTRWRAQILNIIAFELVMLALFFLIGRAWIALEIETAFFLFSGMMNYYVQEFRSAPIVPWDIYSIKTAASVADSYSFSIGIKQIVVLIGFAVLFLVQWRIKVKLDRKKWLIRLAGTILSVAVFCGFTAMLWNDEHVTKWKLYPFLFTPTYMCQANGFFVTYLMDFRYLSVDKPAGYSAAESEEILGNYSTDSADSAGNTDTVAGQYPNIIVVMDEAFSDLAVLGDLPVNEDYMPFMHAMEDGADNAITGYLNVSVKGGNTANTEFEFLTGNSMAFLPTGSIPYQQYINGEIPNLAEYLNGLGYNSYAMHPYQSTGWNRDKIYPYFGFGNIFFKEDYNNPQYVRNYISDKSDFDKIIETYEKKPSGSPCFIFNVTMQNHGSYGDAYPNLTEDVTVDGVTNQYLTRYLSLIKITDSDLGELVDYFDNQEEPTVIVFFGDHQPNDTVAEPVLRLNGMTYTSLSDEETDLRYEVPYLIWANYDINEESGADTSANYLAAKVLKAAGVPTSDYQNYLLDLSDKFPVISAEKIQNSDGEVLTAEEAETDLDTYKKLQYYQLFDSGAGE